MKNFLEIEESDRYYHDAQAADRALKFFPACLNHVTGEWAGQPFDLEPWQRRVVWDVYGWKRRSDGTRRFRIAHVEIPRKNGKSTFGAGLGIHGLCADQEPRAEVYSVAGDRGQAGIIFDIAKDMIRGSATLSARLATLKSSITYSKYNSFYKVLSADARTKFGFNPHVTLFDELFVQPNRRLHESLITASGTRRQPIFWQITTAGYDKSSLAYEQHEHARQVLNGIVEDDEFYPVIFAAEESDDWTDEKVWFAANPQLGRTLKLETFRNECKRAMQSLEQQNSFRRFRLNQWTKQESRWMDVERWKSCASANARFRESLRGTRCFGGLDLATRLDLVALCLHFPTASGAKQLFHFWCPEATIEERSRRDRVPYDAWARNGFVTMTRGNVADYDKIRADINALSKEFRIEQLGIDEWNATQIAVQLEGDSIPVVLMRQGFKTLSEPTKELEKLVVARQLEHDGSPVMTWMVDNVTTEKDAAGNVKPSKEKSREKIDGVVAAVMATGLAIRRAPVKNSVYETRGIRVI
ncbi:MAG TPA: terminase TerL endonuclease subunit [Candidatus Acidoferrum sp.]|nr:terminase TerL endonuclease subunit [Candidatus Acidoferrum sp.]